MRLISISRRVFLAATGAAGVATLMGCGLRASTGDHFAEDVSSPYVGYRLSTRGKRASKAAKRHAANKLFVSPEAADAGRAHPGDTSSVVRVDLSEASWMKYFGDGATTVDLRPCIIPRSVQADVITLQAATIKVGAKVGEDGKLFGSVTALQLVDAVRRATGIALDRRSITLPDEIKTIGTYEAELSIPCGETATFRFEVVEE